MNSKRKRQKNQRRARRLSEQAWQSLEEGNLPRAIRIMKRATEANPGNPLLWYDLGRMLQDEDENAAAQVISSAITLAPDMAEAYVLLAEIRARQGLTNEAAELQQSAVRLNPGRSSDVKKLEVYRRLAGLTDDANEKTWPTTDLESTAPCSFEQSCRDRFPAMAKRIESLAWSEIEATLTREGVALVPRFLKEDECREIRAHWEVESRFGEVVVMDKPHFGLGEYRYFRSPLPPNVDATRRLTYPFVAKIVNRWQRLMQSDSMYPSNWEQYRSRCGQAGQTTPTPILLKYGAGGFNSLHRDIRGNEFFPIQLLIVLSPRDDQHPNGFSGGRFLFCDDPERRKKDRRCISAGLGDAVLFCTRSRPVNVGGVYGLKSVNHGLERIIAKERFALGVPFHEYS